MHFLIMLNKLSTENKYLSIVPGKDTKRLWEHLNELTAVERVPRLQSLIIWMISDEHENENVDECIKGYLEKMEQGVGLPMSQWKSRLGVWDLLDGKALMHTKKMNETVMDLNPSRVIIYFDYCQ